MTSVTDKNIQDLTGRELLSYIQKEKRELEKSGVLKKQKPFPPIPDEIKPFQLPDNWEWVRLGDVSRKVHYGYTASATDKDTGVKMLRITDIQDNKVDWNYVPYCEIDNEKLELTRLYPNDILFARTGGTVGKSFLVKQVEGVSVFASYLIRVQLMEPMNPEFIKFFFESPLYWKQIIDAVTGTGQPNVNATSLSNLMIPIPSLTEQAEIVTKLKNSSMLKENIKETVSHEKNEVKRYRLAILQEAMQGKLVEKNLVEGSGKDLLVSIQLESKSKGKVKKKQELPTIEVENAPCEIPSNWTWARLEEIFQFIDYRGRTPQKTDTGIPLITAKNIKMGYVSDTPEEFIAVEAYDDWMTRGIPSKGDLLFTTEAPMGNIASIDFEYPFALAQRAICFKPLNEKIITKAFQYFMMSPFMQKQIEEMSTGTTVRGIKASKLKLALIPLPPFSEQQSIVERLDAIMAICDRLEEELERTKTEAEKWHRAVLQETFQPKV